MAEDTPTPADPSQANGFVDDQGPTNPYETNPGLLPKDDAFLARSVHYGRYAPRDDDFKPRYDQWYESDPEVTSYWEGVVKELCTAENSLNLSGGKEAFAAGSVIIRIDQEAEGATEKYSCVNANELSATRKAEDALKELGVAVPVIYFCGTVDGKNVTVQSRIPGVALEVAWRYLDGDQIDTFKKQCRRISQRLGSIDAPPDHPSYVCSGLNSQLPPDTKESEKEILFHEKTEEENLCLVHNNLTLANIIVHDDNVIGVTGWRHSGYFGFDKANETHRRFRIPAGTISPEGNTITDLWYDVYKDLVATTQEDIPAVKHDTPVPQVKTEPSNVNIEGVPLDEEPETKSALPQLDGAGGDYPTPKNIASLKNQGSSRASSSDRSSPATSTKPPGRKSATSATKKGTGRKTAPKKRKLNDPDNQGVDGRSNTPSSSRASKAPGKRQKAASAAGSPAPDSKKKGNKNAAAEEVEEDEEDDDSEDNNEIFCICRKPDNHTWMIGCDGGCEDWFHGKCINIDRRDADLIDKYICPNCKEQGKGWTTWKPMCRLKECRKPARVNQNSPSKYCSDDHGREFMLQRTKHLLGPGLKGRKGITAGRTPTSGIQSGEGNSPVNGDGTETPVRDPEDIGSKGGVLTAGDLKAVIMGVASAQEFRKLGESIISIPAETEREEENTSANDNNDNDTEPRPKTEKKLGLDFDVDWLAYSPDESSKIEKLRKQRADLLHRKEMLRARNTFMTLIRQRSKAILELLKQNEPKGGWKDICGFDSRLAWSDEEFDEWRLSEMGAKALEEGTPEALAASYPDATDADGDTAMDEKDELETLSRGVCTKKRCERHRQWLKVQQQDDHFEETTLALDLKKCEKEARNVVERAVLRMWAEKDNAQVRGE
ncbi:PHD transcription factor [Aspergillus ellipticus CBS 707.79]|uniref:PHD transcription factor n=1 Tax=Aspergillus ellipticus CBS 707.79 TaxID=1448320 RepID=A0A319D5R7_9EURO|nr:PHD transcription factor [Aspergillus ellipticus CBS 707.79]